MFCYSVRVDMRLGVCREGELLWERAVQRDERGVPVLQRVDGVGLLEPIVERVRK